jgi:hypothetical protein
MKEQWESCSYSVEAFGSTEDFELEVREYKNHPDVHRLNLVLYPNTHSRIILEFTLLSFDVLEQVLSYLQVGCLEQECQGIVKLGKCFGRDVTFAQDNDWLQRYFIVIRDKEFPMGDTLTFTIAGDRTKQFVMLLEAILEELQS